MKTCIREGCFEKVWALNFCPKHYHHYKRYEATDVPKCKIHGCDINATDLEMCRKHYQRYKRSQATDRPKCYIDACDRNATCAGLCDKHYKRYQVKGNPEAYSANDSNEFIDNLDGTHFVILRKRNGEYSNRALFDTADILTIKKHKWCLSHKYAATSVEIGKISTIRNMHQILIPVEHGMNIDHISRNTLDNRRKNLRICFPVDNCRNKGLQYNNTSGYTGVSYSKQDRKWYAYIRCGKTISLGKYSDIRDAILARLRAEKKYFGEFSPQRHLFAHYGLDNNT